MAESVIRNYFPSQVVSDIEKLSYDYGLRVARAMVSKDIPFIDITDRALFYHADYVTPGWAKTKKRTTRIGNHIFYRWEIGKKF